MQLTYAVYRLALSSGVFRVRKADRCARLAAGLLNFPLLAAAADTTESLGTSAPQNRIKAVNSLCKIALVDAIDPQALLLNDRLSIAAWADTSDIAPAVLEGTERWRPSDFQSLITGPYALLVDSACVRYGPIRPSVLLGLEDPDIAFDLDLAIAYRGLTIERQRAEGEEEVEVEDVFGRVFKVPQRMLPEVPAGAKVVDADAYAQAYGPGAWSAGGGQIGQIVPLMER